MAVLMTRPVSSGHMNLARRVLIVLLVVIAALVAVVAYRTATYTPPTGELATAVDLAPVVRIDGTLAARHLAEAVRFRTVSHQDAQDNDWAEWDRLHAWLAATYPAAHAAMTREVVAGHTLVYTWRGMDPSLPPIVLMAHHDVVPVTPGTEQDWTHPPFDGVIADGAVWGRGSVDDKGSLVGLFEGIESLVGTGFVPRRTVYVVSGHDEEAGGEGRPRSGATAEFPWRARRVRARRRPGRHFRLPAARPARGTDRRRRERLRHVAGHRAGQGRTFVGAATGDRCRSARQGRAGDHRQAISARIQGARRRHGARTRTGRIRCSSGSPWRTSGCSASCWSDRSHRRRLGAATLHTTIAPTMLRGSPKENVLPQDATAWINYRIAPGTTADDVMRRATDATQGLGVQLAWEGPAYDPSPVSSSTSQAYRVMAELAAGEERTPGRARPRHGHDGQSPPGWTGRRHLPLPADRGVDRRTADDPRHQRAHDDRQPAPDG